ncbi:hypothetical protein JCM10207_005791 [Rhodosporidiobolus poonsookiae]
MADEHAEVAPPPARKERTDDAHESTEVGQRGRQGSHSKRDDGSILFSSPPTSSNRRPAERLLASLPPHSQDGYYDSPAIVSSFAHAPPSKPTSPTPSASFFRAPHLPAAARRFSKSLSPSRRRSSSEHTRGKKLVKRKPSRGDELVELRELRISGDGGSRSGSRSGVASPVEPLSPTSPTSPGSPAVEFESAPTSPVNGTNGVAFGNEVVQSPKPDAAPREGEEKDGREITREDRHYLSRMLVNLQLQHEFSSLSQIGTLAKYGTPFAPHANGPNSRPPPSAAQGLKPPQIQRKGSSFFGVFGGGKEKEKEKGKGEEGKGQFEGYVWDKERVEESPVCQYLFWRFIYNAPALRSAKPTYWTEIQHFIDSFAERDLSSTVERGEVTKRRMLSLGIVRILGTYYSTCLRSLGPASPARPTATMMRRIDLLVPGGMESMWRVLRPEEEARYGAWVAVVEETSEGGEKAFRILTRALASHSKPLSHALRPLSALRMLISTLSALDADGVLALPVLPSPPSPAPGPSRADVQTYLRHLVVVLSAPHPSQEGSPLLSTARREVEAFLLSFEPQPTESELDAWVKQAEREEKEDDERHRAWVEVGRRVRRLRSTWVRYRRALIEGDELDQSFLLARKHKSVDGLPEAHRDAEEWARIWVAYALHYIFVAARTGPEVLNILRSFHELIPYGAVKVGLNIINPTLAIKAIVQLILGQPAGQQSLFQRIWSHVCHSANKHQQKLIVTFRKKIAHDGLCDALKKHVEAPYVQRQRTKEEAIKRDEDIVLTILRERGTPEENKLVQGWHAAFVKEEGLVGFDDGGASKEAKLFADLKELLAAYYRHRDRIQVLEIALEANTPKLLHATIATFYDTIRDVANASRLSDRVADLQAFLDDLVRTCESGKSEPYHFISLVERHHDKLWYFLHELSANNHKLLDPIIAYCKSGLSFIRDGVPPHTTSSTSKRAGLDVDSILSALSPEEQSSILSEVRGFARWSAFAKAEKDIQLRCDLLKASSSSSSAASPPAHLSPTRLTQSLLALSPEPASSTFAAAAAAQDKDEKRTGPGGDLEWAWWAERELASGAAGSGVVKAHAEAARAAVIHHGEADEHEHEQAKKGKGKKSPGVSRRASHSLAHDDGYSVVDAPVVDGEGEKDRLALAVPTPAVERTRTSLLGRYLEQVKGALEQARNNEVK